MITFRGGLKWGQFLFGKNDLFQNNILGEKKLTKNDSYLGAKLNKKRLTLR